MKKPDPCLVDDDNPLWTDEDFARMRPAHEVFPELVAYSEARKRGQRGPQKKPNKVLISLRISAEALAAYKRGGKGYQTRMAEILAAGAPALVPQPPHPKKGRFDGLLRLAGTWDNKLSAEEFTREMRK